MDGKHCGEQILAARRRAGLSQEGLATLVGVSPQAVRKWECGKTYPRRDKWPLLEQKMNLSPGWFFALQAEEESDVLRQNVAQTGVNHGTVAGVVQAAPVVPAPVGGGEIERDLCERIVQYLKSKSTDEKIEFRARVKAFMEGQPGEVQSERL